MNETERASDAPRANARAVNHTPSFADSLLPRYAMYYLTDWCNATCSFCNIWRNNAYRTSPLPRVREDIADLKRLGVVFVDFTGGEPLMRPDCTSVFRMADEAGLRWGFTNNGSLFERRWPEMKDLGPYSVNFSLDSANEEYHDAHRELKGGFRKVVSGIRLARSAGWPMSVILTPARETASEAGEMVDLTRRLDCSLTINPLFSYKGVGGSLTPDQLRALRKYRLVRGVSIDERYIDWLLESGGNDIQKRTCRSMNTHVVIAPDSSLFVPCYHYSVGRLPTPDGIYAAVHSEKWGRMSGMAGRYPFCQGCAIYCYMDASLALAHPVRTVFPLLRHMINLKR